MRRRLRDCVKCGNKCRYEYSGAGYTECWNGVRSQVGGVGTMYEMYKSVDGRGKE